MIAGAESGLAALEYAFRTRGRPAIAIVAGA